MGAILTSCVALLGLSNLGPVQSNLEIRQGYIELTHGYVIKNGHQVPVAGIKLPYTAKRIVARDIHDASWIVNSNHDANMQGNPYKNDNGDGTYYITTDNPSCLDDIQLDGTGFGAPWKWLQFGVDCRSSQQFLVRWRMYHNFVQGRGPGVSAFDNEQADFGGKLTLGIGTWNLTVDVSIIGFASQDGTLFVAQQFREPLNNGEGAFNDAFSTVFSGGTPSIGSSEDICFLDMPAHDGIYDETEVDYFGGPPNEANFLWGVTTGGTSWTRNVTGITVERGQYLSGDQNDLLDSDDFYYQVQDGPHNGLGPVSIIMTSQAPSTNLTSYTFVVEASANNPSFSTQVVELFNYSQNKWVVKDVRPTPLTDQSVLVVAQPTPSQYVNPSNRQIKTRIRYFGKLPIKHGSPRPTVKVDQAVWYLVTP